ncbi:hypothetical protein OF83DRAFT_1049658 [Amylostereum chailletii]|nr:hypothetical protein OF83DRAFT_1049658 [Amylostereum chailletii]
MPVVASVPLYLLVSSLPEPVPAGSRVSLTDYRGNIVLDTLIRPTRQITDYRHSQTNLNPENLANGAFMHIKYAYRTEIRHQVVTLIHDKIIVGYALWDFLSVMGIPHPAIDTRDVAIFLPFRRSLRATQMPPLPVLVNRLMGRNMALQQRDNPLENARAALDLFRSSEQFWESLIDAGSWPCTLPPPGFVAFFT